MSGLGTVVISGRTMGGREVSLRRFPALGARYHVVIGGVDQHVLAGDDERVARGMWRSTCIALSEIEGAERDEAFHAYCETLAAVSA